MYEGDARVLTEAARMARQAATRIVKATTIVSERDILSLLAEARSSLYACMARIDGYTTPSAKR